MHEKNIGRIVMMVKAMVSSLKNMKKVLDKSVLRY